MAEQPKKKILVVDDEVDIVNLIKDYLEINNYSVITATDGDTALKLAFAEKPDLITLDIMMGNKDGYETCLLLRENEGTNHIPIIIITGRSTKQAEQAAASFGADMYLSKPFELQELSNLIKRFIG
ncbi:MAG: response regulator [Candidatus Auribacterota bacterium]|jgi:two-component system response regulator VicR|nr:response regulator [Candidatus Auribacterota bacterium]